MAYKVQIGAAHLEGLVSGSSTVSSVGSLSSSGDLAVTGAVHAATLFGDGAGITNISADGIDVTSSVGDIEYTLVFTEGFQTDGTLGLGGNTALNYNPNDGVLSSSAGLRLVSEAVLGGALDVSGAITFANTASLSDVDITGAVSASSTLQIVGTSVLGNSLNVSGAATLASTLDITGLANLDGGIEVDNGGNKFTVSTAGVVSGALGVSGSNALFDGQVSASAFYGDGSNLTGIDSVSGSERQYSATGMETSGYLKVSGSVTLAGVLSSSAAAEIVGNVLLGGQLGISGGVQYQITTITSNTHLTASTATTYQVVSGGTAAITVMLPSASAGENYQYAIKRHALMSGNVVLTGSDLADVIDGNASLTLETAGASLFLISDGTQWNIF